jgi:hypothetical protein
LKINGNLRENRPFDFLINKLISYLRIAANSLDGIFCQFKRAAPNSIGEAVFVMIASGVSVSYNALFLL